LYPINLSKKTALVFGVANHRSIAWSIAKTLHSAGANLILAYQNERLKENLSKITEGLPNVSLFECDVSSDENIEELYNQINKKFDSIDYIVHSIAFANREDLSGEFINTPRKGFLTALEISAYSLIPVARLGSHLLEKNGGSIITMTFQASERVFPGYNVMATAKSALENSVKNLAYDLGKKQIRINAISAGPLDTLSSRVISGYKDMKTYNANKAPLQRNITFEEVANTALFLCSDLSTGITGEIIHVDAGYNIMGI
tara:strand:- start:22428 stop:23204 length:777 start_codon:yes stop_codon:yes gene_type:complete